MIRVEKIKERPFDLRSLELDALLKSAANAQRRRLERAIAPFGLSAAQFECLRRLGLKPQSSAAELSRAVDLSPQTMSVVIANLEKKELLVRAGDEGNLRILRLALTSKGAEVLAKAQTAVEAALKTPITSAAASADLGPVIAFLKALASP